MEGLRDNLIRVMVESGPKGKMVAAVAPDWPGLERGGKTADIALERLRMYMPRYAAIAKLAGMEAEFANKTDVEVVEQYTGPGSTDFWGISFGFSSFDKQAMTNEELERELRLMQACWAFFDQVRHRVSAELRKGPRGGGRDRDRIVRHIIANQVDWAKKLGVPSPLEIPKSEAEIAAHYQAYCSGFRSFHSEKKMAGKWPLRYLIRHTAYHTLDHTWEMEDKDLTERG